MTIYLDTNVIVAALESLHPDHDTVSRALISARDAGYGFVTCLHAVGETFATVSKLSFYTVRDPSKLKNSLVEEIEQLVEVVALDRDDYRRALLISAASGTRGGGFYDALHLAAAERHGVSKLWTYNTRHFNRFRAHTPVLSEEPELFEDG